MTILLLESTHIVIMSAEIYLHQHDCMLLLDQQLGQDVEQLSEAVMLLHSYPLIAFAVYTLLL